MAHAREQIRDAVVSALGSIVGVNLTENRVTPYQTLPSINVLTEREDNRFDLGSMGDIQIRELRLVTEIRVEDSTPDDDLDDYADEVFDALVTDSTLVGLVMDIEKTQASWEHSNDGSVPIGKLELTFAILYEVDGNDPSQIIS